MHEQMHVWANKNFQIDIKQSLKLLYYMPAFILGRSYKWERKDNSFIARPEIKTRQAKQSSGKFILRDKTLTKYHDKV